MAVTSSNFSGPWFETPLYDEARADRTLAPEVEVIVDDYARDGYVRIDFGFDESLVAAVADETRALTGTASRAQDLWRKSDAVRELATAPQVLSLLSALYERRAFPFQTLNFPRGSQQRTHSDTYHFNSFPPRFMCGLWIALEDIDEDNGPLHYYPGSHRLPVLSLADIGDDNYETYEDFVGALLERRGFKKKLGLIKRGEAILWSANLFHGGDKIKDEARTRLSQVTHYYFDDCLYYTPRVAAKNGVYVRLPYDFSREQFVFSRMMGKRVFPSAKTMAAEVGTRLMNKMPTWNA